ncbi:MAG: DoxX family protein [Candidatus Limnocylindrales bacterium]
MLLALAFLSVAYGHALGFEAWSVRPGFGWMTAVGRDNMRIIGGLELLGSVGLILPAATGVLPWLTPVAATCLAVLMALSIIFHARRHREGASIVLNLILGLIAVLVAYGRFVVAPL